MASDHHSHRISPLIGTNYTTWSEEMKALLRSKGLWRLVDGKDIRPTSAGADQDAWDIKQDKAAGEIMLNIAPDQRIHIREHQDDPNAAWDALKALYVQQKAGTRFVAYDEFFSIRKRPDETLTALIARVEQAMARIQELRPSTFDIKTLDAELACMSMIRALGPDYSHFTSSLALLTDLDKDKVKAAFQTEDINRRPRPDAAGDSVLFATPGSCSCNSTLPCTFCEKPGHCQCKCFALQRAREAYKTTKRKGKKANTAQTVSTPTSSTSTPSSSVTPAPAVANSAQASQDVVELAGNASARSIAPSHPSSSSSIDSDGDWNADSGATAHMTPHRHWLRNYTPKRVPIKLADNTIVYSAGVGSVVFHPIIEGKRTRAVEFTRVLHVPELRHNLLSVLYLTKHAGFVVNIDSFHMVFSRPPGPSLFLATIRDNNAAFLDGSTVSEAACPATSLPLDLSLWHRRLAHHHMVGVKELCQRQLVTGL